MVVKLLLTFYLWVALVAVTLLGLAALPFLLLSLRLTRGLGLEAGMRRCIRLYGWVLVCLAPWMGPVRVDYRGGEIPVPAVLVANHNSALDPYLFGAIEVENGFVTSWPFRIPVYSGFMRLAGYANSDEGWEIVLEKCRRLLAADSCVTIWPEGHRSRDGRLRRFKNGAFLLSQTTGRPVVPICILGSGRVLPPGKLLLRPGRIRLIVLEPEYPRHGLAGEEQVRELRDRVRRVITETLREQGHFPEPVAVRGEYC